MTRIRLVLLICLAVAACDRREITFESDRAGLKTIAIAGPAISDSPEIAFGAGLEDSFGLPGFVLGKVIHMPQDNELKSILAANGVNAWQEFNDALVAQLKTRGYTVIAGTPGEYRTKFLSDYPTTGADATLDVAITGYGYRGAFEALGGIGAQNAPLHPFVDVRARLVDSKLAKVLMRERIAYFQVELDGSQIPRDIMVLPPDPHFTFRDFSELRQNPANAAKGVHVALTTTAVALADLLQDDNTPPPATTPAAATPVAAPTAGAAPLRTDCATEPHIKGAAMLDMFEKVTYVFDNTSRCVTNANGTQSVYAVFAIPKFTKPSALSIQSRVENGATFIPAISLLAADGSVRRRIPPHRLHSFSDVAGTAIGTTVKPRPDEAYLLIESDPQKVGQIDNQLVARLPGAAFTVGSSAILIYFNEEHPTNTVLSATGRIVIEPEFVFDDK